MKKNFQVLMVLGPPGSGKGTQIKILAKKLDFYHSISSHLGKEYIETHSDSETLRQKENYKKGLLFDPEWMFKIVKEKTQEIFRQSQEKGGIIYDGSPRTLYEAERLYAFLTELIGRENIKILEIGVDEKELESRIKNRLILEKRVDDKLEIFKVRMDVYKKETLPALEFLKKNHEVITINGNQNIKKVHEDIMQNL